MLLNRRKDNERPKRTPDREPISKPNASVKDKNKTPPRKDKSKTPPTTPRSAKLNFDDEPPKESVEDIRAEAAKLRADGKEEEARVFDELAAELEKQEDANKRK